MTPDAYDAHLAYLRAHNYTALTVTQLVTALSADSSSLPEKPIVITFDDGFADFHEHALPILKRYDFTATLYITTGYVGSTSRWLHREMEADRPMLTWGQISELLANGIECGAHSCLHPQLDTSSRAAARKEINESKDALEQHLGQPVSTFAYPHGYYNQTVRQLVQEAKYSSACGVKHAMSAPRDDRFALARIIVEDTTNVARLARLLTGEGLQVAPTRETIRTQGWRLVRRFSKLWH